MLFLCQGVEHWEKFYDESDKYHFIGYLDVPDIVDTDPLPDDTLCSNQKQKEQEEEKFKQINEEETEQQKQQQELNQQQKREEIIQALTH